MVDRTRLLRSVAGAGAVVALIGTFLPWLSSGSRSRSSYQLFSLVDRLGFSSGGGVGWALRLWPCVPFLLVTSLVLHGAPELGRRHRSISAAVTLVAVVYVGGTAAALRLAPDAGLFRPRIGVWVTLAGALAMAIGVVLEISRRRSDASGAS